MWYNKNFYSAYVSIISNHSKVVKNINHFWWLNFYYFIVIKMGVIVTQRMRVWFILW